MTKTYMTLAEAGAILKQQSEKSEARQKARRQQEAEEWQDFYNTMADCDKSTKETNRQEFDLNSVEWRYAIIYYV